MKYSPKQPQPRTGAWLIAASLWISLSPLASALPGDVDANGVVDNEDARAIARYLTGQIAALPDPAAADATQDGTVNMEDAFVIAKRVTGESAVVVAAPRYGRSDALQVNDIVRVELFEKFFPHDVPGATVRIRSASQGYDSGEQPMVFNSDGRSLYFHWNTTSLQPVNDYQVVILKTGASAPLESVAVSLSARYYEPPILASAIDAECPAPGIPLVFRRVAAHDSRHFPYQGPLGRGWAHNYDVSLEEYTDGRIAFHGPEGFNRFYTPMAGGTYEAAPGDHGRLTRDGDGTFQVIEKSGLSWHFRSDLRFDFIEDRNGNRVTAFYDTKNQLVEVRHSCGKSFHFEYSNLGYLKKLVDHAGRTTTYSYGPQTLMLNALHFTGGLRPAEQVLLQVERPDGGITRYKYNQGQTPQLNWRLNQVRTATTTSGKSVIEDGLAQFEPDESVYSHFEYNPDARLTRSAGTWGANPLTYTYENGTTTITDGVGAATRIQIDDYGQVTKVIDPDGGTTRSAYDSARNLVEVVDPLNHTSRFDHDEFGNLIEATNPLGQTTEVGYNLKFHKPAWVKNPLGKTTAFEYDGGGNLTKTTAPDGAVDQYFYDAAGNRTAHKDPLGRTTGYGYNAQGRVTALANALKQEAFFEYSDAGDLTKVTNARGHALAMERDALGRVTRQTYADSSHEDYEYDAAGQLKAVTNRRGQRVTCAYNAAGQMILRSYPSGKKYHFLYDGRGLLKSVEKEGGGVRTLDVDYEADLSRRITKTKVLRNASSATFDVSYNYDAAGRRSRMIYPDGYVLNYEFDDASRLTKISDGSNASIVSYQYDAAGRRTRRTLGNGTYTVYGYDDASRLTSLKNHAPNAAVQSSFDYTYNDAGVRTTMTTTEGLHEYAYDDTYQVTGVQYPDGRDVQYEFDAAGNRAKVTDNGTVTNYVANELDQYESAGADTFAYDDDGNLQSRTSGASTTSYGWDEDGRLVSVNRNGALISYRYDYQGHLIAKTVGGVETRYIWDQSDLIAELNSSGQIVKRYICGATIDEVPLVIANNIKYWCQQDGLGSAVETTNDSGEVIAACSYDIYGNVRSGNLGSVPQRLAGMRWDEDARLYYVRARWFSANIGRFISPDPIGLRGGGVNVYCYSGNSPCDSTDPFGLASLRKYTGEESGWGFPHYQFFFDEPVHLHVGGRDDVVDNIGFIPKRQIGDWSGDFGIFNKGDYTRVIRDNLNNDILRRAVEDTGLPDSWIPWIYDCEDWANDVLERYDEIMREDSEGNRSNFDPSGGMCPTFIQQLSVTTTIGDATPPAADASKKYLSAQLGVPLMKSMLRSDIPIFGVAGGENFKSYRVEVGAGAKPEKWELIKTSSVPQNINEVGAEQIPYMQGDVDLRGNLATWNCGLSEWEHLPWHPAEEDLPYNGIYTIRLVVEGKDGKTVEDRVTCEVGRVIAQCLPGMAQSPDKKVMMRFPEQSLLHPFRVYGILPVAEAGEEAPPAPGIGKLLGKVYRIREPGDRYIKDVTLVFAADAGVLQNQQGDRVGIACYDMEKKAWKWLPTEVDSNHSIAAASLLFTTRLSELPAGKACFALVADKSAVRSTTPASPAEEKPLVAVQPGVLIDNTFETDLGTFKARDRWVGATLSRDNKTTPDGSHCLKLVNENHGGNFACTVMDQAFDVREYPVLSFDYRIGPGVKSDFLLKVNGRWYSLRFTGGPVDYHNKDVNIANLGFVEGVIADEKWHTVGVDLGHLLRQKTRHTRVEEIMMADWRVGGYMKLEFGDNARGATFYLDNVRITGSGTVTDEPAVLLVDDFDEVRATNLLGGQLGYYCNPGARYFQNAPVDLPPAAGGPAVSSRKRSRAMQLSFDMTQADAFGGFWTSLQKRGISGYNTIRFRLKCGTAVPPLEVGIRTVSGGEDKTIIAPYASAPGADGWHEVQVPTRVLGKLGDLGAADVLFFSASRSLGSGKGEVLVDDLRLEQRDYDLVASFEDLSEANYERQCTTFATGAAALSAAMMSDPAAAPKTTNSLCRISYGGSIGKNYGLKGGFSYAYWQCALNGTDGRSFKDLSLRIRGDKGGETPNFYLSDGAKRICLRAKEAKPITTEWQEIRLPLAFFGKKGIDLSRLNAVQLAFEWNEQSGTVYVDDIHFVPGEEAPPAAASTATSSN